MTIKHLGGIFGRNPTFEDVTIEGQLTFDGDIDINSDLKVDGDLQVTGSVTADTHFTSSDGAATLSTSGSGGIVYFRPNGKGDTSGQVRVLDNGNVDVTGGNVVLASGQGIDFSATSGTGTSELFDDYEEGTWTPVVEGATSAGTGTYGNQVGIYTKVGRVVQFQCWLQVSSHTGTGNCLVKGLPFTASSSAARGTGNLNYFANLSLSASHTASLQVVGGQTYLSLKEHPVGGGVTANVDVDPNMQIRFSGSYTV